MSEILFPIGRLIGGSVSKLRGKTQQDGKTPRLDKEGKQMQSISFGVAIPKTQQDWRNEPWGQQMFAIAKGAFPVLYQTPSFAYKVLDGDSAVPNKNGKAPNTMAGHKGHWVIWFSQSWAPKMVSADGQVELPAEKFVTGFYVQVYAGVQGNGQVPPNTPGLFLNPIAVALAGEGEVIASDVDTTAVGFGGALPVGATPVTPAVAAFAPAPAAAAPVAITPNAAFMTPPPPAAVVPPPAAAPVPQMTAKAGGATYEAFIQQGWTPDAMRAQGYLV